MNRRAAGEWEEIIPAITIPTGVTVSVEENLRSRLGAEITDCHWAKVLAKAL